MRLILKPKVVDKVRTSGLMLVAKHTFLLFNIERERDMTKCGN